MNKNIMHVLIHKFMFTEKTVIKQTKKPNKNIEGSNIITDIKA